MRNYKTHNPGSTTNAQPADSSTSGAVAELAQITARLLRVRYLVVIPTSAGLALLLLLLFSGAVLGWRHDWPVASYASLSLLFGGAAFAGAALHEIWRKRGDTLFGEISDGIQRGLALTETGAMIFTGDPALLARAKETLRAFADASDLPLIPGKFGPTIYAAVNLLIPILVLFSARS